MSMVSQAEQYIPDVLPGIVQVGSSASTKDSVWPVEGWGSKISTTPQVQVR